MSNINKYNIDIDYSLHGFLVGSKLGDGGFIKKGINHNTYIVFKHCQNQLDYLEWKYNFLKKYNCLNNTQEIKLIKAENIHGYDNAQNQYTFATKSLPKLNKYKLTDRINLIEQINDVALSIYLLDDGNFYEKICKISCSLFSDEERNMFVYILKEKFNIQCNIYNHKLNRTKDYFRIPASEFSKIQKIICNVIPENLTILRKKEII